MQTTRYLNTAGLGLQKELQEKKKHYAEANINTITKNWFI
jgi:hypothetical protein